MIYHYASQYALKKPVSANIRISSKRPSNILQLNEICIQSHLLDLYIWLSLRFPDWFIEQDECLRMKAICIDYIESTLHREDLKHKFCHATEYKKIRWNNREVGRERRGDSYNRKSIPLPPPNFGEVRELMKTKFQNYDGPPLYSFPHAVKPNKKDWSKNKSSRSRSNSSSQSDGFARQENGKRSNYSNDHSSERGRNKCYEPNKNQYGHNQRNIKLGASRKESVPVKEKMQVGVVR